MAHQVNSSGECVTCKSNTNEGDNLTCYDCKTVFHAVCKEGKPYGNATFVSNFNKCKVGNFIFVCNVCLTKRKTNEASGLKDQIEALASTVASLANEFKSFKEESKSQVVEKQEEEKVWSNKEKVAKIKASLCIKSNGSKVNMRKVQEIATSNSIQVSRTTVKENGDVFVDLPSVENREKLTPLLSDGELAGHDIVELKSKLPTISILDVKDFESKEEFIEKVKKQNPGIKQLIEAGSVFSIVFSKSPTTGEGGRKYHQVVARVSEDVRKAIKASKDRLFVDLSSYRVVDRFYVKRCNKCQKFGHYEKDCENDPCCAYCSGPHMSVNCQDVDNGDHDNYKCVNCKDAHKDPNKHSALWHKCPVYMEVQRKLKKTIPYYQKN